jgi:hypothetical protein
MAYVEVDIDIEDYLDECESKYMVRELNKRGFKIPEKEGEVIKDLQGKEKYIFPDFKSPEHLLLFIKEAIGLKPWHDQQRVIDEIKNLY